MGHHPPFSGDESYFEADGPGSKPESAAWARVRGFAEDMNAIHTFVCCLTFSRVMTHEQKRRPAARSDAGASCSPSIRATRSPTLPLRLGSCSLCCGAHHDTLPGAVVHAPGLLPSTGTSRPKSVTSCAHVSHKTKKCPPISFHRDKHLPPSCMSQLKDLVLKYKPVAFFSGHDHVIDYTKASGFETQIIISGAVRGHLQSLGAQHA